MLISHIFFNLSEIQVQNLVDKLGFVHKGTMDFLESLKQKGSLDYRIIIRFFAIEVKSLFRYYSSRRKENSSHTRAEIVSKSTRTTGKIQYIEFQEAMKIEKFKNNFLEKSF